MWIVCLTDVSHEMPRNFLEIIIIIKLSRLIMLKLYCWNSRHVYQVGNALLPLTFSMLRKIFSRRHIELLFIFFPRKHVSTSHANCPKCRQFAWKILFSAKNTKNKINHWIGSESVWDKFMCCPWKQRKHKNTQIDAGRWGLKLKDEHFLNGCTTVLGWQYGPRNAKTRRRAYAYNKAQTRAQGNLNAHVRRHFFICSGQNILSVSGRAQASLHCLYNKSHYENTPIQMYCKFQHQTNEGFQIKILIFFLYFCSKLRLWVLVRTASPRRF